MRYDADTHTYYADDDSVLPGVTTVCQVVSPLPTFRDMEDSRDIGRDVHLLTQLFDENDLDVLTIDPFYTAYLAAWQAFLVNFSFVPIEVEEAVEHPKHRYAGTLDRVGLACFKGGPPVRTLIDIKTGVVMPVAAIQTAAYAEAWNAQHSRRKIERRLAVYLREDGSYLVEPHIEPSDFAVFLNALGVYRWRMTHA